MSNADEPAFPAKGHSGRLYGGVTKRELFAAILGAGCCALGGEQFIDDEQRLAQTAISQADALLAELDKPRPQVLPATEPDVDAY